VTAPSPFVWYVRGIVFVLVWRRMHLLTLPTQLFIICMLSLSIKYVYMGEVPGPACVRV
jgi:hypothetical protein